MGDHPMSGDVRRAIRIGKFSLTAWLGAKIGILQYFEKVVRHVLVTLGREDTEDTLELRVLVAMALLGPQEGGLPAKICEAVICQLREFVENEQEQNQRVVEFALAYGCGRFRRCVKEARGWEDGVWEGAVLTLERALEPYVRECDAWLRRNCDMRRVDVTKDAHILAMSLIHPQKDQFPMEAGETIRITSVMNTAIDGTRVKGGTLVTWPPAYQEKQQELPPGTKRVFLVEGSGLKIQAGKKIRTLPSGAQIIVASYEERTTVQVSHKTWSGKKMTCTLLPSKSAKLKAGSKGVHVCIWECTCGHIACAEHHSLHSWNPAHPLWALLATAVKGRIPKGKGKKQIQSRVPPEADHLAIKIPIVSGSFVQGMYCALLSKGFLQGERRDWVQLRYVPLLFRRCPGCGAHSTGTSCHRCGRPVGGSGLWTKTLKPSFILTGEGQSSARRAFVQCGKCGQVLDDEDILRLASCVHCGRMVWDAKDKPTRSQQVTEEFARVAKGVQGVIGNASLSRVDVVKKLREMRKVLVDAGVTCRCGNKIEEVDWSCPRGAKGESHSIKQRAVYGWVRGGRLGPGLVGHMKGSAQETVLEQDGEDQHGPEEPESGEWSQDIDSEFADKSIRQGEPE